uniref:putative ubiquitin-conjugating enzyme E2 38 n=1 Tax=Erigeron canadensis TaxID=72917 RepID=UPI001CB971D7|nr:putative ubiquitin-conjugating enzyme E2 38 [Erigeron canadensis]
MEEEVPAAAAGSSQKVDRGDQVSKYRFNFDAVRKYRDFQKFDIVEDYSDHYYAKSISTPSGKWAKKIEKEWRILEKGLPDTIYVRVYESRMDLLRAVIKGAEGTPYHDGLFFFDVCFPNTYPRDPPKVHYHSGGLSINPNLYSNGYVCLSLLNTWYGSKNEKWTPGVSTMLQVLVSIQGLVLNAKPYLNEPLLAWTNVVPLFGGYRSKLYNEEILMYSLKTMVYTMNKPPKHFEDLVVGHFRIHAHDILKTFKSYYMEGIGSVRCGVDNGKKTSSRWFKKNAKSYMDTVIRAFEHIGVENVDEYIVPPAEKSLFEKIMTFLCLDN